MGYLTDSLNLCDDYHYSIIAEDESLPAGNVLSLKKELKMTVGTRKVNCGFVQLDGETLVKNSNGYTLNEPGEVTLVWYTDRTTAGGTNYRVYSNPVKISFLEKTDVGNGSDAPSGDTPTGDTPTGDTSTDDSSNGETTDTSTNNSDTTATEEKNGCGSTISATALAVVCALGLAIVPKKKSKQQ